MHLFILLLFNIPLLLARALRVRSIWGTDALRWSALGNQTFVHNLYPLPKSGNIYEKFANYFPPTFQRRIVLTNRTSSHLLFCGECTRLCEVIAIVVDHQQSHCTKSHTHDITTQMSHILRCRPIHFNGRCLQDLRHFEPYRYRSRHFSSRQAERGPLAAGYRKNIALRKIPIPIHLSRLNLQLHSLHSHTTPNKSHTADKMAELTHPTIKDGKIFAKPNTLQWLAMGLLFQCFAKHSH